MLRVSDFFKRFHLGSQRESKGGTVYWFGVRGGGIIRRWVSNWDFELCTNPSRRGTYKQNRSQGNVICARIERQFPSSSQFFNV